jgi:hypothetical protein
MNINKKVVGRECRFAVYCPPQDKTTNDLHLVKEILHYDDGTSAPNVNLISNYKRPFYITKKNCRNHKQKKEWELKDRVNEFESTQTELIRNISKRLEEPWFTGNLRQRNRNPYVYGSDILSTAVIKHKYQKHFADYNTQYSVAPFDVETDVNKGTNEIICATISFKDRVFTAIQRSFIGNRHHVVEDLHKLKEKYLGPIVEARRINWEFMIVDDEISVVKECFLRAHEWKPDFVAIWNIDFDMQKLTAACKRANVNPAMIFSDPKVPDQFKFFHYKQGPKMKVTASGQQTPIKPAAQWHTVFCPSSFYFIDAMCAYRHIRNGQQEEVSYSLDAIMDKHLDKRKLKFEVADKYSGLEWHKFLQEFHPLEYIIYNGYDCIGMEELDEKINDLSLSLPMFSGCSDFENFKSQPRRLADALHYFIMEREDEPRVMGSTSDEMTDDLDKLTLGLDDWIITLPAHLVADNGLQIILENAYMRTNFRSMVADLDVAGS